MAELEPFLTHPLAATVGWALLHSLWQGTLVAALFALGLLLLWGRSPQARYLLGCGALLLLVLLPPSTVALHYAPTSPVGDAVLAVDAPAAGFENAPVGVPGEVNPSPSQNAAPAASPPPYPFRQPVTSILKFARTNAPWLAAGWLLGVALLLVRLSAQALYAHRFRRHTKPLADAWQARGQVLAQRLGVRRAWRLVQSGRADSPLTLGWLRPLVVLPTSALTGLPAAQLEAVLLHELAHVRRHDYLVNLLQCLAETLLFYHPAAWWVSGQVRRAREERCDDLAAAACGDARLYAGALAALEALRQPHPPLALAAAGKPLLARVRRLLEARRTRPAPFAAVTAPALLLLAACASLLSQPSGQDAAVQPGGPSARVPPAAIVGRVVWHDQPLAGVVVEHRTPLEATSSGVCCKAQRVLAATTTDGDGAFAFEGLARRAYMVHALVPADEFLEAEQWVEVAYMASSVTLRLDKRMGVIGPSGTTGASLTPTLHWKPFPGAARYSVGLFDHHAEEAVAPAYRDLVEPRLTLDEPLERDRIYSWWVTAYADDGTRIASSGNHAFSTGPEAARFPVTLPDLGVRTALPGAWRQVDAGTFEQTSEPGRSTLTFERTFRDEPAAVLSTRSGVPEEAITQPFGEKGWWATFAATGGGVAVYLATARGGDVYLVTARSENASPEALLGLVLPAVRRNFVVIR